MKTNFLFVLTIMALFSGCCCDGMVGGQSTVAGKGSALAQNENVEPKIVLRDAPEVRWEESMYDTIDVPGQLDPSKTYYRAPHRTVVEVRPGKHKNVTYSGDR